MERPSGAGWLRRLAASLATLLVAALLSFALGQLAPGDAFTALELDPSIPAGMVARLRRIYLPDQSLGRRLLVWLGALGHGDLGYSLQFHRPVLSLLRTHLPASLQIVALGLAGAWLIGFLLAAIPAWLDERGLTRAAALAAGLLHAGASFLAALPAGLLALLVLLAAPNALLAGIVSAGGSLPWLPAAALALSFLPMVYFNSASVLREVQGKAFIDTARAAGLEPWRILWRHLLPNTTDLLVPVAALSVPRAVVELVVIETLFAWPGIGQLAMQSAAARDMPLLAALVLLTTGLVVAANWAADLLQVALNPRLRADDQTPVAAAFGAAS